MDKCLEQQGLTVVQKYILEVRPLRTQLFVLSREPPIQAFLDPVMKQLQSLSNEGCYSSMKYPATFANWQVAI